jgi:hypothetical protein
MATLSEYAWPGLSSWLHGRKGKMTFIPCCAMLYAAAATVKGNGCRGGFLHRGREGKGRKEERSLWIMGTAVGAGRGEFTYCCFRKCFARAHFQNSHLSQILFKGTNMSGEPIRNDSTACSDIIANRSRPSRDKVDEPNPANPIHFVASTSKQRPPT